MIKDSVAGQNFKQAHTRTIPVLNYLKKVLFLLIFEHFHEYLKQPSLNLGGTKWVKRPGTNP